MGLRAFHLLFIGLSVILAAFFAAWAGGQYQQAHDFVYALTGGSLLGAAGLVWYGASFERKTRNL
jgi:hypothetical protein